MLMVPPRRDGVHQPAGWGQNAEPRTLSVPFPWAVVPQICPVVCAETHVAVLPHRGVVLTRAGSPRLWQGLPGPAPGAPPAGETRKLKNPGPIGVLSSGFLLLELRCWCAKRCIGRRGCPVPSEVPCCSSQSRWRVTTEQKCLQIATQSVSDKGRGFTNAHTGSMHQRCSSPPPITDQHQHWLIEMVGGNLGKRPPEEDAGEGNKE